MSKARNHTASPDLTADDMARFIIGLEISTLPYAKRLRRLERIEDRAYETISAAEGYYNVYPLHSGARPPHMDAARAKASTLARAALEAVKVVRQQLRDGAIGTS